MLHWFLIVTGMLWTNKWTNRIEVFGNLIRVLMIFLLVLFAVVAMITIIRQIVLYSFIAGYSSLASLFVYVLIILNVQVISLIPSVLQIRTRLHSNYTSSSSYSSEINHFNTSVMYGWLLMIISIMVVLPVLVYGVVSSRSNKPVWLTSLDVAFWVSQSTVSSASLSLSLVFTLTDIRVSNALVNELLRAS
jgi:hypothetical protein